jgi:hypothetical protein
MKGSRAVDVLFKGSRPIWMSPDTQRQVTKLWLDANVQMISKTVQDSTGHWFEVEVILPDTFTGNPADGWTGPMISGYPDITLGLFRSEDLSSWESGGWITSPGSTPETMSGGRKKWFARYETTPVWWEEVMVDMTVGADLYGKSITGIQLFGNTLALDYPYTPTEIADGTLEADLQDLGIAGASVAVTTGTLTATARWHTQAGAKVLQVTMSGSNITDVKYQGSTISATYPYAMPSQQAALQTALTSALGGDTNNRVVVLLHKDAWTITLPDLLTTGNIRDIIVFYDPGDPYPTWDMFGNYQGMSAAAAKSGDPSNVRNPSGDPLDEAGRAFARMGFIIP